MNRFTYLLTIAILALSATRPAIAAEPSKTMAQQFIEHEGQVFDFVKKNKLKNVGTLSFLVKLPNKEFSRNVGTMNKFVSRELEFLLIRGAAFHADAANGSPAFNVLTDAAEDVARQIQGVSSETPRGRAKLFEGKYQVLGTAGPPEGVTPDGFLTGEVVFDDDRLAMTVKVLGFTRDDSSLKEIVTFRAKTTSAEVGPAGGSSLLKIEPDLTVAQADRKALQASTLVLQDAGRALEQFKGSPVALSVYYDDVEQQVEVKEGRLIVATPKEKTKQVKFVLTLRPQEKDRYACVLKLNGENTIYRQKQADLACASWILSPGDGKVEILGMQEDEHQRVDFKVLRPTEEDEARRRYGADLGSLSLSVFAEANRVKGILPVPTEPKDVLADALSLSIIPKDAKSLHDAYHSGKNGLGPGQQKGLIAEGDQRTRNDVVVEPFRRFPIPVYQGTITYFDRPRLGR